MHPSQVCNGLTHPDPQCCMGAQKMLSGGQGFLLPLELNSSSEERSSNLAAVALFRGPNCLTLAWVPSAET